MLLLVLTGAGGAILIQVNPSETRLLPGCVLHKVTGLACPGCGVTRATHALLHGQFGAAFRFNPLFLLVSWAVAYASLAHALRWATGRELPLPKPGPTLHWFALALLVSYMVVRNLACWPWPLS